jgi:putative pyruvate formate lyase activating enzyme
MASERIETLQRMLRSCMLCPRACRVDRTAGETGACRIGDRAVVASAGRHFGEEPVLVGRGSTRLTAGGGSGTIFFAGCNLDCAFCQNADISHSTAGQAVTPAQLAALAVELTGRGCENVNFVTPTHVAHAVAEAIVLARRSGLDVPTVYNCGGYESAETLRRLDGLIDIYMPDFKWADAEAGRRFSGVPDYPEVARAALAEMYRQVGPLEIVEGVATRGVLVRHLVMPGDLAKSRAVVELVAETAPGCAINVMAQYRPCYRAAEFPELRARPDLEKVAELRRHADALRLRRVDH